MVYDNFPILKDDFGVYPLGICYIAIENGIFDLDIEDCYFPYQTVSLPEA